MSALTEDKIESNYKGSALLHLLSYMKPYAGWVSVCLLLVLALTAIDLYRPMLIGDAIICSRLREIMMSLWRRL